MTTSFDHIRRGRALGREMERLQARMLRLQAFSNRVSWVRVGVFIGGLALAVAAGAQVNAWAGGGVLAVALVLFGAVVAYHRRLERWIEIYTVSRDRRADLRARLGLDWENMPTPAGVRVQGPLAFDLDLIGPRSLHQLLDTTLTREASQKLAGWLTQARPVLQETQARQRLVRELLPLERFRTRFWLTLRLVLKERLEGENVLRLLGAAFPSARLKWTLVAATVLVAVNLFLFAQSAIAKWPAYWIASLGVYFTFYLLNQVALGTVLSTVVELDAELDRLGAILRYLETAPYCGQGEPGGAPHLGQLCAPFGRRDSPSAFIRRIKLATAAVGLRSNLVLGLLLNLILPWDFFFAFVADQYRAEALERFPAWLQVLYELDALVALANYAALNPDYVFPEIEAEARPILRAEQLGHPLIPREHQVRNDLTVETPGRVAIITGSNMAGKSTFVKTVGVNMCLAQAGAPVNATSFCTVPFRLHTCIRITDSIVDGFSYFYAEVKCLKGLLTELQAEDARPLLYLIDEIFRGTNNRERLLGSRAYIQACAGANGVGLLATHDLELATLAETHPQVRNYHFRDEVRDGRLAFDYRLRPGPCPTTNALKIMQMEGLPVESSA